jgi:pilus assembly protein FimV
MDLQPVLNSQMFGMPLYVFGGAVLLSLFGLGYWLMRDEGKVAKNTQPSKRQIDHVIDHYNKIRTSSEPLRVTSDFYGVASKVAEAAKIQPNYFDPIGGADLFLSFGRDGQAESILQEALSKNPENHQIHLKLLSIYADRGDARSFARIAAQLKDSGDAYAWGQATIMGAKLEPENPMYSGDTGVISTAAAHLAAEVGSTIDSHGVAKSDVDAAQSLSNKITGLDFGDVNLNLNKEIASPPAPLLGKMNTRWHDAATKLDLAKAYYEMGDIVGAREILEEVVREGDPDHRADAETFLRKLPS